MTSDDGDIIPLVRKVHGVIRRRLLVNFRVDPDELHARLPPPFRPKLHEGHGIAGICLIRLEDIRPKRVPRALGLSSENAAHRIAVEWNDDKGSHEGVYIPRRDTSSLINHLGGGRLFPGLHHYATFDVRDDGNAIDLKMQANDGSVAVHVRGHVGERLPESSTFATLEEASRFFERGAAGYSPGRDGLDGIVLHTVKWRVEPLAIDEVQSTFFDAFPAGSVAFDCALVMRNIEHVWEAM